MDPSQAELLKKILQEEDISKTAVTIPLEPRRYTVVADIYSGYTFRRMVEIIADNSKEGSFIFSKSKIETFQNDNSFRLFIHAVIFTSRLIEYHYDVPSDELEVGFNFIDLQKLSSGATKKKSVKLSIINGAAIYQVYDKDGGNNFFPVIKPTTSTRYDLKSLYTKGEDSPIVTCFGSHLTNTLNQMSKIRGGGDVEIYCYADGIEICPKDGHTDRGITPMGKCSIAIETSASIGPLPPPGTPEYRIALRMRTRKLYIPKALVKSLCRLKHICSGGTVRIYVEGKGPLKIATELDKFGSIEIVIRDEYTAT